MTTIKRIRRLSRAARYSNLLDAACRIAVTKGYMQTTREDIAKECGVSPALVSHVLGNAHTMRRLIMRHAVANAIVQIVAQGLVMRDSIAKHAPPGLITLAVEFIRL